ncbi:MAG: FecR family protein [Verrucomicrobiota bacterium]
MKKAIVSLSVVLLAFGISTSFAAFDEQGYVTEVTGTVTYAEPGSSDFRPLKAGKYLDIGSTIRTGADGTAIVSLVRGSAVNVQPDTELVLTSLVPETDVTAPQVLVNLRSGTMSALIDRDLENRPDFRIETPQGTAAARGTFYSVSSRDGVTYAAVKEGQVAVTRH